MHLSTRGRYAVMAMLDLAQMQDEAEAPTVQKPVTLAEIAERQEISLSYLEQLFARLRRASLVKSIRGPGGGYVLASSPENTWLSDIINAVDEPMNVTRCGKPTSKQDGAKGCVGGKRCNAHQLWAALGQHIELFMQNVSLKMVLDDVVSGGQPVLSCTPTDIVSKGTEVRIDAPVS